jgi:[ribosomal protein S5]-alanine N-acetyltransferase
VFEVTNSNKPEFPQLKTNRMNLRILELDHVEEVFQHFSDEAVTRFMDIEPCRERKEAEEIIHYHLEDEGCRWGLFEKSTNRLIGTAGFHYLRRNPDRFIAEVGFDLSKHFWGKGYMTEAMKEVLSCGFEQMGFDIIDATVEPENSKSIRLLEKLGFKRDIELKDHLLYFYLHNPKAV